MQEVRRTGEVLNSPITLSAVPDDSGHDDGKLYYDVRASSAAGIVLVTASIDGLQLGSLTQPNDCAEACEGRLDIHQFAVDPVEADSGDHTLLVGAVDADGNSREIRLPVSISNGPTITLRSPLEGEFVSATLHVDGSVSSDKSGVGITVTATLGEVEFLRTRALTITGGFDLTGLLAGSYTLTVTVTARDSTGASSELVRRIELNTGFAYTPLFTLPPQGSVLATDASKWVYRMPGNGLVLRDLNSAAELLLAPLASKPLRAIGRSAGIESTPWAQAPIVR